ncbi:hypothetical protein DFH07DRAFT_1003554 [Mycena maculata]|uniref:C2H2-type domain-containing protein n=1 Tax=Mycena maculata TaxID=230809 RepID=A0AAD7HNR4_9AGAR|nr:hypothetical protein DFH07DRAFT_1003554 [Mycena maculata]
MGGDHKCPVCQATFTRPQHVARHMRSHTGDRPYKCQHCGDQFARSDLLSRHVNKCHAAEKARDHSHTGARAWVCAAAIPIAGRLGAVRAPDPGRRPGPAQGLDGGDARDDEQAGVRPVRAEQLAVRREQSVLGRIWCGLSSGMCARLGVRPVLDSGIPGGAESFALSKCISRKTRCTFVQFHRQTAPVGPGHPSSLAAQPSAHTQTLPSLSSLPPLPGLASAGGSLSSSLSSSSSLSAHGAHGLTLTHPSHGLAGLGHLQGQGQGQPALSANSPHPLLALSHQQQHAPLSHPHEPPPFLYAQQAASGGGGPYAFPSSARDSGGSSASSPTSGYAEYDSYGGGERRLPSRDGVGERESVYYPSGAYYGEYRGEHAFDGREFDRRSEHSSVSGGSRPQSSAGAGDYSPYLPNGHEHGRQHAPAPLDLQHAEMQGQRGEFSSAFGLMSLDDPSVLAGLAADGVPFFASAQGRAHGADGEKRMQLVPPLAYQAYPGGGGGGGGAGAQTPSTREAETRELREFWRAYMRTPLTGPGDASGALGMQTPCASAAGAAGPLGSGSGSGGGNGNGSGGGNGNGSGGGNGNGGRRYRVASLPSAKTPEGGMEGASYAAHQAQGGGQQQAQQGRTMHNADDLRSYEAAVLARKAPELTLRKPGRRPTTSAGAAAPLPPPFEFGREGASQSSLAGAFGFSAQGFAAAPPSVPGTPSSVSASASEDGDEEHAGAAARPSFKRLPSQTLGPPQAKRRRDRPAELGLGAGLGMTTPGAGAGPGGALAGGGLGEVREGLPSVNAYPDRPMIGLRGPPAHPQRRARRLSAPTSPTAPGFVI